MLSKVIRFVKRVFDNTPVYLAIVRRYVDANGSHVGELYVRDDAGCYHMVGMSLDTLPLDRHLVAVEDGTVRWDVRNDFLKAMPPRTVRVGAQDPRDDSFVRAQVAKIKPDNVFLSIRNNFVEEVLEPRPRRTEGK